MARPLAVSVVSKRASLLRHELATTVFYLPDSRDSGLGLSPGNAQNHRVAAGESQRGSSRSATPVHFFVQRL